MKEPRRFSEGAEGELAREIARSLRRDAPRDRSRERAMAALGLGGASMLAAKTTVASTGLGAWLTSAAVVKWASVVIVASGVTVSAIGYKRAHRVPSPAASSFATQTGAGDVTPPETALSQPPLPDSPPAKEARADARILRAEPSEARLPERAAAEFPARPPPSREPEPVPQSTPPAHSPPRAQGIVGSNNHTPRENNSTAATSSAGPLGVTSSSGAGAQGASSTSDAPAVFNLAEQTRTVDTVRLALRKREYEQALKYLDRFERDFPSGALREEALALRIEADLGRGAVDSARRNANDFFTRFPQSTLTGRVQRALDLHRSESDRSLDQRVK